MTIFGREDRWHRKLLGIVGNDYLWSGGSLAPEVVRDRWKWPKVVWRIVGTENRWGSLGMTTLVGRIVGTGSRWGSLEVTIFGREDRWHRKSLGIVGNGHSWSGGSLAPKIVGDRWK